MGEDSNWGPSGGANAGAAAGWGGDAYALYRNQVGLGLMTMKFRWDTEHDLDEFWTVMVDHLVGGGLGSGVSEVDTATATWRGDGRTAHAQRLADSVLSRDRRMELVDDRGSSLAQRPRPLRPSRQGQAPRELRAPGALSRGHPPADLVCTATNMIIGHDAAVVRVGGGLSLRAARGVGTEKVAPGAVDELRAHGLPGE